MLLLSKPLYIYIDEGGDFNFSPNGSLFYTITALATYDCNERVIELDQLRQDILAGIKCPGLEEKYLKEKLSEKFHATEDKQPVRDLVFAEIQAMRQSCAYSIVIRKNRMNPVLQAPECFYPKFMGYLLDYIFKAYRYSKLEIKVSGMPVSKQKNAFLGAVKRHINSKCLVKPYNIEYPPANSHCLLQVVDYINWAVYRKWAKGDERSYLLIQNKMGAPELDIFRNGNTDYY